MASNIGTDIPQMNEMGGAGDSFDFGERYVPSDMPATNAVSDLYMQGINGNRGNIDSWTLPFSAEGIDFKGKASPKPRAGVSMWQGCQGHKDTLSRVFGISSVISAVFDNETEAGLVVVTGRDGNNDTIKKSLALTSIFCGHNFFPAIDEQNQKPTVACIVVSAEPPPARALIPVGRGNWKSSMSADNYTSFYRYVIHDSEGPEGEFYAPALKDENVGVGLLQKIPAKANRRPKQLFIQSALMEKQNEATRRRIVRAAVAANCPANNIFVWTTSYTNDIHHTHDTTRIADAPDIIGESFTAAMVTAMKGCSGLLMTGAADKARSKMTGAELGTTAVGGMSLTYRRVGDIPTKVKVSTVINKRGVVERCNRTLLVPMENEPDIPAVMKIRQPFEEGATFDYNSQPCAAICDIVRTEVSGQKGALFMHDVQEVLRFHRGIKLSKNISNLRKLKGIRINPDNVETVRPLEMTLPQLKQKIGKQDFPNNEDGHKRLAAYIRELFKKGVVKKAKFSEDSMFTGYRSANPVRLGFDLRFLDTAEVFKKETMDFFKGLRTNFATELAKDVVTTVNAWKWAWSRVPFIQTLPGYYNNLVPKCALNGVETGQFVNITDWLNGSRPLRENGPTLYNVACYMGRPETLAEAIRLSCAGPVLPEVNATVRARIIHQAHALGLFEESRVNELDNYVMQQTAKMGITGQKQMGIFKSKIQKYIIAPGMAAVVTKEDYENSHLYHIHKAAQDQVGAGNEPNFTPYQYAPPASVYTHNERHPTIQDPKSVVITNAGNKRENENKGGGSKPKQGTPQQRPSIIVPAPTPPQFVPDADEDMAGGDEVGEPSTSSATETFNPYSY